MDSPFELVFWNVENLFDPGTGGPRKDYTPEKGWTRQKFDEKVERLKGVLFQNGSPFPDLLALAEVDTADSIKRAMSIFFPSGSHQAVFPDDLKTDNYDNALLFNSKRFSLIRHHSMAVLSRYPKGDILFVELEELATGEPFLVIVNHWASRVSGQEFSESFRCTLAENLQGEVWKLTKENPDYKIVIVGDFNDDPFNKCLMTHLLATYDKNAVLNQEDIKRTLLFNASWKKLAQGNPPGTLYYEFNKGSGWNLFDQALLSRGFLKPKGWVYRENSFEILNKGMTDERGIPLPCLIFDENRQPVIIEGYSDHFPIRVIFDLK